MMILFYLTHGMFVDGYIHNNMIEEQKNRKNFMSVDGLTCMNSYGEFFNIGDEVKHESQGDEVAVIEKFEADGEACEIIAYTNLGTAHIDFIYQKTSLLALK
jgi:hypothetical protein